MSHIRNYDMRLMTLVVVMVGIMALLSDWILRSFLWGGRGRRVGLGKDKSGAGAALIVIGLLLAVLSPLIGSLIRMAISRKREFLADASSAQLTRYPAGLASALRKIAEDKEPLEAANKATAHLYIANPLLDHKGKSTSSSAPTRRSRSASPPWRRCRRRRERATSLAAFRDRRYGAHDFAGCDGGRLRPGHRESRKIPPVRTPAAS